MLSIGPEKWAGSPWVTTRNTREVGSRPRRSYARHWQPGDG